MKIIARIAGLTLMGIWAGCTSPEADPWPPKGYFFPDSGAAVDVQVPGQDSTSDVTGEEDSGGGDSAADDVNGDVLRIDDVEDAAEVELSDVPILEPEPVFVPPGPGLWAGWAEAAFSTPLGISIAGYGQAPDPKNRTFSPYASSFYATRHQYGPPGVRALVLYRGDDRLLLIQTDLIAVQEVLLQGVLDRLLARTGQDFTQQLLLMSNHTHGGPARWIPHPIGGLVADEFHHMILDLLAEDISRAALNALGSGEKVRWAHGFAQNDELHNDRRCENPPLKDGTMGILALEREESGELVAVLLNYGVHGTAFGPSDVHLSGDVPKLIEQKVAEHFDSPVHVMFVQSWAGDMSPANPKAKYEVPTAVKMHNEWVRMEALGMSAAETVLQKLPELQFDSDAEIASFAIRVPISFQSIGYTIQEFAFTHGGFLCGGDNSPCKNGKIADMKSCLPMPPSYALTGLRMAAARIGDLTLFSLPGEPVTQFTLNLLETIRADTGKEHFWPVGYSMDHLGYLMGVEDWLAGGYESSFTFWGPRQGEYVGKMAKQIVRATWGLSWEIPLLDTVGALPEVPLAGNPIVPEESVEPGIIVQQPVQAPESPVAQLVWHGGDPWVDKPEVQVEEMHEDRSWSPVLKHNGEPLDSRSYELALHLETEPVYHPDNFGTGPRIFRWQVRLFGERPIPSTTGNLKGRTFRFVVRGDHWKGGAPVPYQLESAPFDFGPR